MIDQETRDYFAKMNATFDEMHVSLQATLQITQETRDTFAKMNTMLDEMHGSLQATLQITNEMRADLRHSVLLPTGSTYALLPKAKIPQYVSNLVHNPSYFLHNKNKLRPASVYGN